MDVKVQEGIGQLGLPPSKIQEIVNQVKFEEFEERIKKAKAEILKASKIQIKKEELEKAKLDFKNLYRQLLFKEQQLSYNDMAEVNTNMKGGLKQKWQIRAERDIILHQIGNVKETLELYGFDTSHLKKEIEVEFGR